MALITIPGLAYNARKFVRTTKSSKLVQYYLPQSDAQALDWVAQHGPAGGILAPTPFAAVVPSQTGRPVWVGHGYWSQDYPVQAREVDRLFGGRMSKTASRAFVPPPAPPSSSPTAATRPTSPASWGRPWAPCTSSAARACT